MKTEDLDYHFSQEQIATEALADRPSAKLLVYDRAKKQILHHFFYNLPEFMAPGDVLVLNESKVLPARFFCKKPSGESQREGLFIGQDSKGRSIAWLKGKFSQGDELQLFNGPAARILEKNGREFCVDLRPQEFISYLEKDGLPPLPPYILQQRQEKKIEGNPEKDREDYQTVFAKDSDRFSVAAPTASLHFDQNLLDSLKELGVKILKIKLHVGIGTFQSIESPEVKQHQMHSEMVEISKEVWDQILSAKNEGKKIVGVGTTVCRSLESAARMFEAGFQENFSTDLFIHPPFEFKILDSLITNFHQPRTSLLALVGSFVEPGVSEIEHLWKDLYQEAVEKKYRLFSFGDGMLIQ